MPFSGDLASLGKLQANLGKLAAVPSRVASSGAEKIKDLIEEEFDADADPYGRAWAPLQESTIDRKSGDDRVLERDDILRPSVDVKPMGSAGISISLEDYAGFHQGGFKDRGGGRVPARPILPGDSFPKKWTEALEEASEEAFAEAMGQ